MPERPNILVFITDQQRGCTVLPDHPLKADTPHLDRFRAEAATFSRAYCPSPHCCPSRTTFFTGLMPTRHGVWHNVNVPNAIARGPFPGTPFWSEALKAAGYRLGFSGKWHVSNTDGPARWGWEEGLVTAGPGRPDLDLEDRRGHALNGLRNKLERLNPEPYGPRQPGQVIREGFPDYRHYGTVDNPFRDGDVAADGCRQLDALAAAGDPWCLYVGTLGPHDPYTPPEAFLDRYPEDDPRIRLPDTFYDDLTDKPELYRRTRDRFDQLTEAEHRAAIRHYLAFCSYEDALFGQVLDRLEASGQADNTLVVFLSDHGDYLGDHGLWAKGLPAFQSAYHVPAVVRLPAGSQRTVCAGRTLDPLVSLADFGPTFLEVAGLDPAIPGSPGQSLLPWLRGERPASWRDALHFQTQGNETYGIQRTVLTDAWQLTYNGYSYDELYDLRKDPEQKTNLLWPSDASGRRQLGRYPEQPLDPGLESVVRDLYRRLWAFGLEHDDTLTNDYIMTALGRYGPGITRQPESSDADGSA